MFDLQRKLPLGGRGTRDPEVRAFTSCRAVNGSQLSKPAVLATSREGLPPPPAPPFLYDHPLLPRSTWKAIRCPNQAESLLADGIAASIRPLLCSRANMEGKSTPKSNPR
jgi:hypothetical protein